MKAKQITTMALLTAIALGLYFLEAQLPAIVPIPGVKPGLANIITLFSLYMLGRRDTFFVLIARILLASLFAGHLMSLLYSLSGGLLCYGVMLILFPLVTEKQVWAISICGAIAHNIGQLITAALVMGTWSIIAYLPVLMISAVLTGLLTGICAQVVISRLKNVFIK